MCKISTVNLPRQPYPIFLVGIDFSVTFELNNNVFNLDVWAGETPTPQGFDLFSGAGWESRLSGWHASPIELKDDLPTELLQNLINLFWANNLGSRAIEHNYKTSNF
ncbi:hypothetical protein [Microcoleus sp. MON2_D5]|uniref:hypothetical protein n=1 Tax=Microcoleus sp. MON2_D5 TaxID=2818833 RepID=UPI002FD74AB7